MANEEQLAILRQGVEVWNKWREKIPEIDIDLSQAKIFIHASSFAPSYAPSWDNPPINLRKVNFSNAKLDNCGLRNADLSEANLSGAMLAGVDLQEANLTSANLSGADLRTVNCEKANFTGANLSEVNFWHTDITKAYLRGADLSRTDLRGANFIGADLREVNFSGTNLVMAQFTDADLRGAKIIGADLDGANLINTKIDKARLSGSSVYGVSVWGLKGKFEEQRDLVITPEGDPVIIVDNIKIAQFIYLILNNEEIRDVINTLTSKSVLILGRFALPERKEILDALRNKLREYDLLPIVFDFDRPTDKDFTETIKTLAGLCYFVIADVTNPKSSPLELQATVPDYQIPFVPIIQEGESPFAMMVDLQKKYNWVLNTVTYDSIDTLMKILKPLIIDPAMIKRQELRIIKAQEPEVISGRDFLEKGK